MISIPNLRKTAHLKVLENEGQYWVDHCGDEELMEYHGYSSKIEGPKFNRVGFYLMTSRSSGLIDCWEEYRLSDGTFVSLRTPTMAKTFRFRLDIMRDDLPNEKMRTLLKRVQDQGFRLPKEVRYRIYLGETRDELRESGRSAALYAHRFHKRYLTEEVTNEQLE